MEAQTSFLQTISKNLIDWKQTVDEPITLDSTIKCILYMLQNNNDNKRQFLWFKTQNEAISSLFECFEHPSTFVMAK